jgi:hypothetical protein
MGMKQVCIKVMGVTDREPIDRTIQPGTTAAELVNDCGLRGFILSLPNGTGFFGPGENVYAAIQDGDCLMASTPASVA